jgi:cytochrome P450
MHVDTNHKVFSSEGGITLDDQDEDFTLPMFIAMGPPKHNDQRMVVSPVLAPINLVKLESTIRARAAVCSTHYLSVKKSIG